MSIAASMGTTINYYDFFITGTIAATVWPRLFYPTFDPYTALLLSIATYGIGFLGRPAGAFFFGHIGDRLGRKASLVWTLMTIGLGTLALGLTPSYVVIGLLGGVLLIIFRFLQGMGLGGEWGGASSWIRETTATRKSKWKAFWTGWINQGPSIGIALADGTILLILSTVSPAAYLNFYWRLPFFIGAGIALIGIVIRYRLMESPIFKQYADRKKVLRMPEVQVLKENPKKVLLLTGSSLFVTANGYMAWVFAIGFVSSKPLEISPIFTTTAIAYGGAASVAAVFLSNIVADLVGRKTSILIGSVGCTVFALPFMFLLSTGNFLNIIIAEVVISFFLQWGFGPLSAFMPEQFELRYRASGTGIAYELSSPIAGGLGPIIAASLFALYGGTGAWVLIGIMLLIYSGISVISIIPLGETKEKNEVEMTLPADA